MKRVLGIVMLRAVQSGMAAVSIVVALIKLSAHWSSLQANDVILVYHQGGFGHTIHGPDLVRRLFPGRRITVLYLLQRTRHNPMVARIWPDVRLVFLPIEFAWRRAGKIRSLPWFLGLKSEWLYRVMKRLFPQKMVLSPTDLFALARRHGRTDPAAAPEQDWIAGYFNLLASVPAPPPRLPTRLKQKVERALTRCKADGVKLCCLYLRDKGSASDVDVSSTRRIGSPLNSYWLAIETLNARGYRVLLVGDRAIDDATRAKFGDGVADARTLGLSHDLLYLYAALESDVAVLECGGGSWLPIYRHIPHLVVNVLPFEFASPGGTIYYKSVLRPNGVPEEPRMLLGKMAQEYEFPGYVVRDNEADELRDAVTDFLDHLDEPRPWGAAAADLVDLPATSWHRFMKSGISPVWLRRYGMTASERAELRHSIA